MTPEEKSLLERTLKVAEENNDMLRGMRRTATYSMIARIIYWGVILALGFGAYYFIQPYFTALMGATGGTSIFQSLQQAQDAANQLKSLYQQ